MKNTCYIIGAGDVLEKEIFLKDGDFLICADAGLKYKDIFKKEPDLIVGDFDSYGEIPSYENTVVAPCEKDETDMMLAFIKGHEKGYRNFVIYGALGGKRADHSVANLQLLHYIANKGCTAFLVSGKRIFTAIKNRKISFKSNAKGYISVFSLTDKSEGVDIKGLKYSLSNATLENCTPIGVSNEFLGNESFISVKEGVLLISWEGDIYDCSL